MPGHTHLQVDMGEGHVAAAHHSPDAQEGQDGAHGEGQGEAQASLPGRAGGQGLHGRIIND